MDRGATDIATTGQSRAAASDELRHAQERHADSGARPQSEAAESVSRRQHSTAACPGTEVGDLTPDAGKHAGSGPTVNRSSSSCSLAQSHRPTAEQLLPDHEQPTALLEPSMTQEAGSAGSQHHMMTAAGCGDVAQQHPQANSAARVSTEQANLGLPVQPSRSQPQSPKPQVSTAAGAGSEQEAKLGLTVPSNSQGQGQSAGVGLAAAPGPQSVAEASSAKGPQTTAEMLKWLDATLAAKAPAAKMPGAKTPAALKVRPA